jgi:hypothetical protein
MTHRKWLQLLGLWALLPALVAAAQATDLPRKCRAELAAGNEARKVGRLEEAAQHFWQAAEWARQQSLARHQVDAALQAALSLRDLLMQDPAKAAVVRPKLITYYQAVVAAGDASNDLNIMVKVSR